MNCFVYLVNPFFSSLTSHLHAAFCGEANYSKGGLKLPRFIFPLPLRLRYIS